MFDSENLRKHIETTAPACPDRGGSRRVEFLGRKFAALFRPKGKGTSAGICWRDLYVSRPLKRLSILASFCQNDIQFIVVLEAYCNQGAADGLCFRNHALDIIRLPI